MTQIFTTEFVLTASLPSRARDDGNTSFLPSGDHSGRPTIKPLAVSLVRGVAPEPSTFITQTLGVEFALAVLLPSRARVDINANLFPSGDQVGKKTEPPAAVVNLVSGTAAEPSVLTCQMLAAAFGVLLPSTAAVEPKATVRTGLTGPEELPPQPLNKRKNASGSKNSQTVR